MGCGGKLHVALNFELNFQENKMDEPKSGMDQLISQIRNNPVVALLIFLGSIVIALSAFTNAARNLWELAPKKAASPDIQGEWQADVVYDWPNAKFSERFIFSGKGERLSGTASFLGMNRGILEGKSQKDQVQFITKTQEFNADANHSVTHRYLGKIANDEIHFVMQTEDALSEHLPVEFIARKLGAAKATPLNE